MFDCSWLLSGGSLPHFGCTWFNFRRLWVDFGDICPYFGSIALDFGGPGLHFWRCGVPNRWHRCQSSGPLCV